MRRRRAVRCPRPREVRSPRGAPVRVWLSRRRRREFLPAGDPGPLVTRPCRRSARARPPGPRPATWPPITERRPAANALPVIQHRLRRHWVAHLLRQPHQGRDGGAERCPVLRRQPGQCVRRKRVVGYPG
jgi:hypothetical protein